MTLDQIIDVTIKAEGGYVNDPADRGGAYDMELSYTGSTRSAGIIMIEECL